MENDKMPYICGPLTELSIEIQESAKSFYVRVADVCKQVMGKRAFVPHERYDPIKHPDFSPAEIDTVERKQVCEKTSLLIVVAIAPSWGGGIEVEMAHRSNVPVLILCKKGKKTSRLLRGNPAVVGIIYYSSFGDALRQLRDCINNGKILAEITHDYNTVRTR